MIQPSRAPDQYSYSVLSPRRARGYRSILNFCQESESSVAMTDGMTASVLSSWNPEGVPLKVGVVAGGSRRGPQDAQEPRRGPVLAAGDGWGMDGR